LIIQNDVLDYLLHAGRSIVNRQTFAKWTFFRILQVSKKPVPVDLLYSTK